jgi:hypothetical protein
MATGVSFAQVLEDTLRATQHDLRGPDRPRIGTVAPPPFVVQPLYEMRETVLGWPRVDSPLHPKSSGSPVITVHMPTTEPPRQPASGGAPTMRPDVSPCPPPPRRLTRAQQRSLDVFVQLGAAIRTDFSPEELRSAFRALARQYHPDCHPAAADADKTRLSRQFAEIKASYETLLTALGMDAR